MNSGKFNKVKYFLFLHLILLLYSGASICSKFAAGMDILSLPWCALYAGMIFILGVYAILWQQVLKKLPLNVAYANKAVTIIWGTVFGIILFGEGESFTVWKVIGSLIVIVGVILMVIGQNNDNNEPADKTEADDDE